jgi:hypothetical protein
VHKTKNRNSCVERTILYHTEALSLWLSRGPRFDRRNCQRGLPRTQNATRKANVPLLRRRHIYHLDIVIVAIGHGGRLPLRRTARTEIVIPGVNHEREFLAHEVAQSLPHSVIESDILVLRSNRTTHILDGFCQLCLVQRAFVEVDKVDGVQKFNGGDSGWVGVRLDAMLFCDVAEYVIRLSHGLLHPLVNGILIVVKPLLQ